MLNNCINRWIEIHSQHERRLYLKRQKKERRKLPQGLKGKKSNTILSKYLTLVSEKGDVRNYGTLLQMNRITHMNNHN